MSISHPNRFGTIEPHAVTPGHVRGLSLHEITQQFGTNGLYTRLQDSLERRGLDQIDEVLWAVEFGLMLHAGDRRTNGPYGDHLIRGTVRLVDHYEIDDHGIITAAPLHDSVEDHAQDIVQILGGQHIDDEAEAREVAFQLLEEKVGSDPVELVRGVTNPLATDGEDAQAIYIEHFKQVILPDPRLRVLKLVGDFTDNGPGNHYTQGAKQLKLDKKYEPLYRLHQIGLHMPDSLITGDLRLELSRQLTRAHARTLARLAMAGEPV